MAFYKVKSPAGPWSVGQIISDDDLKANPQYGGVKRLRDDLGSIEDTSEEPAGDGLDRAPELATGNPTGPRESAEERVSKSKLAESDGPNARRGGKS